MSNESELDHLALSSTAHCTVSSSVRSGQRNLSGAKHVRMGRGLVKTEKYENQALRGSKRSPTSPMSPLSFNDDTTIIGALPKPKWFNASLLRRKNTSTSLGGLSANPELFKRAKRGEVKSWVDAQARESQSSASQADSDDNIITIDIRRDNQDQELSPTAATPISDSPPRLELLNMSSPILPIHAGGSEEFQTAPRGLSPPPPLQLDDNDEHDEDGRILLEALGLEETTSPIGQMHQNETQSRENNSTDSEPMPSSASAFPQIRPLPAIPSSSSSPVQLETSAQQPQATLLTLPPHDSQTAYAYVFGSSPRLSVQSRQPDRPPPPYAPRYSAALDRPVINGEDMAALQRRLRRLELPEVPPLNIRKRDDKPLQTRLIVENS